jgi:hypothetical protein
MAEGTVEAPPDVLVVGGGHFGSRAIEVLARRRRPWRLALVDLDREKVARVCRGEVMGFGGDGVEVLDGLMETGSLKWVVPAVPFHLAHEWILRRLSREKRGRKIALPNGLQLPNPIQGPNMDLYSSYATFLCPEDCTEPREICPVTGLRRPVPLYRLLGGLGAPGFRVSGLRSYQLGPGVGGIRAGDLLSLLEKVKGSTGRWVLFTACRCHGVLSGLETF